ncbi:hypothetical protein KUF83_30115 [Streptomyces sp. BV286]|uniref:hypothetical protein n=1 Tax=Streptomyces sp. BV286 TaxID=2849672 RepID=UPI001C2E026F|nr:hypothetical protein [Streptomyces sp. BV286]MBV1940792.1 hypothetical protein [Streptomyces sp. BV286]
MVMAAGALTPRRPIREGARNRAMAAMMREAERQASPPAGNHVEDLTDPGVHARVAQAGPKLKLTVADIEEIDDGRLEEIAANVAAYLGQNAPDRNS